MSPEIMESSTPNPLRVGFDVSSATSRRPRGIASYIRALLPALESAAPWIEPVLFLRDERWFRKSTIADLLPDAERRWLIEPIKGRLGDLDVFHGMGTRLPRSARLPRSFTLHDLREFDLGETSTPANQPARSSRKEKTIRRADRILCLSEYGRGQLLHHFPELKPNAITVIHHGVDHERFRPRELSECEEVLRQVGIETPFLLQLGSFFPHKNLSLSIEGFARSRAREEGVALVLVGGGGGDHTLGLKRRCEELGITEVVTWVEDLPDTAVPLMLSAAQALLFPSRYEGFGLPILEAMAAGVPGVSSDCACLPEINGGVWQTCEPDDVVGFSAAIDEVVFDEEARAAQVSAGLERAHESSWERCAERTAEFIASMTVIA